MRPPLVKRAGAGGIAVAWFTAALGIAISASVGSVKYAAGDARQFSERIATDVANAPFAPVGQSTEVPSGAQIGIPWTGEVGITETVEQIMARDAAFAPASGNRVVDPEDSDREYPNRSGLPDN